MFSQFDYGKGLLKAVEAHRRLPASQQQKRQPALLKQYESYAQRLAGIITQPGKEGNPGQLKNAAEVLIEAAEALRESGPAYAVYAEMAARSRKVPVVPGMAALVDRLLELETTLTRERAILLSWRVVTGTMKPDRYLRYLAERARLTDQGDDWKDLLWGASQLVKKGTVPAGENILHAAFEELYANRKKLSDQAPAANLALAESFLARSAYKQAESVLMEAAAEIQSPPPLLYELADALIDARPDTCWELHQLGISRALTKFEEGKLGWTGVSNLLKRARPHRAILARWLVDQPMLVKEPRLAEFTVNCIRASGADKDGELLARAAARLRSAGLEVPKESSLEEPAEPEIQPVEPLEVIEAAPAPPVEQLEAAQDGEVHDETGSDAAAPAGGDEAAPEILESIDEGAEPEEFESGKEGPELELVDSIQALQMVEQPIEDAAGSDESAEATESNSNIAEQGDSGEGLPSISLEEDETTQEQPASVVSINDVEVEEEDFADHSEATSLDELAEPVNEAAGQIEPLQHTEPSLLSLLDGMLAQGEFESAYGLIEEFGAVDEKRDALLALEEWLVVQEDPSPRALITLAKVNRDLSGDPLAGLEPATSASLLAPDDAAVQEAYASWVEAGGEIPARRQRAHQAAHLCVLHEEPALLDALLDDLGWLEQQGISNPEEVLASLEQVRARVRIVASPQDRARLFAWTRLYLQMMARTGQEERVAVELKQASENLDPQEALSLVNMLAGTVSAAALFEVECRSLMRDGRWEDALSLVEGQATEGSAALPATDSLDMLYSFLPQENCAAATARLLHMAAARGGDPAILGLVHYLDHRFPTGAPEGVDVLSREAVAKLCEQGNPEAIRFRLSRQMAGDNPLASAADLLALAEQGDVDALGGLEKLIPALISQREDVGLAQRCVLLVARTRESSVDAVLLVTRAGLRLADPQWAIQQLPGFGNVEHSPDALEAIGKVHLACGNLPQAVTLAGRLHELGADASAYELLEPVLEQEHQSANAHLVMLGILLGKDLGDPSAALEHALHLAQLHPAVGSEEQQQLSLLVKPALQTAQGRPEDVNAQLTCLCVLVGSGEMAGAAGIVAGLMKLGNPAISQLIRVFDRIALQDTELPSSLLLAWGRALLSAGKVQQALDRIAGLKESVSDYPEYISLLEEIKAEQAGPGVNMQLGEAYLRVSLWQRAAGEYTEALLADPSLAGPVLTQLGTFGALEPNPNKYPLHLVGLRALALCEREVDWGWALSALAWLIPRWNAEELYGITSKLQERAASDDLNVDERNSLLLNLSTLASGVAKHEEAFDYFHEAWSNLREPAPDVLDALANFDTDKLRGDLKRMSRLLTMRLEAAIFHANSRAVAKAASELAACGEVEREAAIGALRRFQEEHEDKVPVLLARLRLIDTGSPSGREEFFGELKELSHASLSSDQLRELIRTALGLALEDPLAAEPQGVLLQLFDQLGDLSRAWQLSLWHAGTGSALSNQAIEIVRRAASDEFAVRQQIALAELLLQQGEFAAAASELEHVDWQMIGEAGAEAAVLAERLASTPAEEAARRWLTAWYRANGELEKAADHLVWAHRSGIKLPVAWLSEEKNALLLLRAGQIYEISGDMEAALKAYRRGAEDKHASAVDACKIRLRLAELAAEAGDTDLAVKYGSEAASFVPQIESLSKQVTKWERDVHLRDLEAVRKRDDSAQRTLDLSRLLITLGEPEEAISELQAGISRGQEAPEVYAELGDSFLGVKDAKLARRAYEQALAVAGTGRQATELRLKALYGLATAEEALGNIAQAAHNLEQLLVIRHDYRDSRARLDALTRKMSTKPGQPEDDAAGQLLDEILSLLGGDKGGKDGS